MFAFGEQVCQAVREQLWDGETARNRMDGFLHTVIANVYHEHLKSVGPVTFGDYEDLLRSEIKRSKRWTDYQKAVGDALAGPAVEQRKGYRAEIKAWMVAEGLDGIPAAAKRLGVSETTLKSIMSTKGERRYGEDTLERVLKTIGAHR